MSEIKFYDTLQAKVRDFKPLDPMGKEVTLYTCGPTVYNYAHIGNFRTFVFEDLLRRFLEFKGFNVKHVMNITDVDDKTIAGAAKEKKTLQEYTAFYTQAFLEDMKALNILSPSIQPRATGSIPDILVLIQKLIDQETAYLTEDGSVYYRVAKFKDYGRLSKKKLEGNIAGARVDVDEYEKEEGADFVLWKAAKEGEPSWDSPWGKGRPGWHIECSAMCMRYLGETVDIHVGGEDLVFPHHENEIAQSEAATGKPFVNYWLHAKHLLVNGEKMSKSKGNFYTLRDLLAQGYDPMAIRYALLSVHYHHSMNFTLEGLKEVSKIIERWKECYVNVISRRAEPDKITEEKKKDQSLLRHIEDAKKMIDDALSNDLNISVALAKVQDVIRNINSHHASKRFDGSAISAVLDFGEWINKLFGFVLTESDPVPENVKVIFARYVIVRGEKIFAESDALRKEIEKLGWLIKDGRPGEPSTLKKIKRT